MLIRVIYFNVFEKLVSIGWGNRFKIDKIWIDLRVFGEIIKKKEFMDLVRLYYKILVIN